MSATLKRLIEVRSQLVEEVLHYLKTMAALMAELPGYYPGRLRADNTGPPFFGRIRQKVQVVERDAFERWVRTERERLQEMGRDMDGWHTYRGARGWKTTGGLPETVPGVPPPLCGTSARRRISGVW